MTITKRYDAIDLFRVIAAILVLGIHSEMIRNSGILGEIINVYFGRIAVPFFLLITGYFVLGNVNFDNYNFVPKMKKRIIRLLKMYIFWMIVYLPLGLVQNFQGITGLKAALLILKSLIISPLGWGPGWYILTTIISLVFISYMMVKKNKKALTLISVILYLVFTLLSGYTSLLSFIPHVDQIVSWFPLYTSFIAGIPWMFAGMFVKKNQVTISLWWILPALVGFVVENSLIQRYGLGHSASYTFFLFPLSLLIFMGLLKIPNTPIINAEISAYARSISSIIYVIHIYTLALVNKFLPANIDGFLFLVITVAVTFLIAHAYYELSKLPLFGSLRMTY
ncbi:acyltransferase family protein [Weissella confusa]|uniref:acyltransferase family protein n=1 Tax=Weissella confusa TaxID=1583 RepID=UPI00107F5879|nr:acyltransferase [Weissella confusa]MBJ7658599.1 acyltransferase [Weissella confusa]TGE64179.1 hypothetical protein C6P12_07220 [Weissella confusa]